VVAIVPCISVTAVGGRTPYKWLTCWLGKPIAILGTLSAKTWLLNGGKEGDATVVIAVTSIAFVLVQ